jgi:type II secretory pathway pseudopilin PulG
MRPTDHTQPARAFTLVELLVMIIIVTVLIGLLVVGMRHAFLGARRAAGIQNVNSLKVAVQSFKNDFGFVPPLVKDGYPTTPDTTGPLRVAGSRTLPNVYSFSDPAELDFLQNNPPRAGDYRFSVYSLSYYLMGTLEKDIDGVEGPGARKPKRDGAFDLLDNKTFEPYFDLKDTDIAFNAWQSNQDESSGRFELRDPNGVPYRYYRWAQGDPADPDRRGVLNAPALVEAAKERAELGQAEFAIVAAGADKVFGDIGTGETLEQIEDALGQRFTGPDAERDAENAARADNIVEVGR